MVGARVVNLGALDLLECAAPLVHVELFALEISADTSTFMRFKALDGSSEGALHRDLKLLGVHWGKDFFFIT